MRRSDNTLTGADLIRSRIAEAEAALHKLATGTALVEVHFEGRMNRYTEANVGELHSYIAGLKNQLATLEGTSAGRTFVPNTSRGLW